MPGEYPEVPGGEELISWKQGLGEAGWLLPERDRSRGEPFSAAAAEGSAALNQVPADTHRRANVGIGCGVGSASWDMKWGQHTNFVSTGHLRIVSPASCRIHAAHLQNKNTSTQRICMH